MMKPDRFRFTASSENTLSSLYSKDVFLIIRCGACVVLFITIFILQPTATSSQKAIAAGTNYTTEQHIHKQVIARSAPSTTYSVEQQIDIQDSPLSTTSTTYTDASGSGYFLWNSTRYSGLAHVYFEAGIAKNGSFPSTKRIRSGDILGNLVDGTAYKVRIAYECTYNSSANTFKETGYAELWSADNSIEVTSSAVSSTINIGSGTCPTTPTAVEVRFSRLIIEQSNPSLITDTNTSINIGDTETTSFADTHDHALRYPKIWMFTNHTLHPSGGWDSIQDILFSATIASPSGKAVSACLYDITSNTEITCVSTPSTTPTYVTSGDVTASLTDGDQYETYLNLSTPSTSVTLYNSYVTVEQSNPSGLSSMELYDDFNPYNVTTVQTSYTHYFFLNDWEPANYNLDTTQDIPSTNEALAFHIETTEKTTASTGSTMLFAGCVPGGKCINSTVYASNLDTSSTTYTRVRTPDAAFAMQPNIELDSSFDITGTTGNITSNVTWLIINVNLIPSYAVQETTNLAYGPYSSGTNSTETYNQCLPVNAPSNRPGLILIHGGSWIGGDKTRGQFETLCNEFAAEGYVVFNLDYRLASLYKSKNNQWPDQIGDIQLAVRYMRANAAHLGLDPTRICAYGSSSGSQLSLLSNELQTIHASDVSTIDANYSPTTQCTIDLFGPTDLTLLYNEVPSIQTNLYDLLDYQTPTSDPTIYQDASPVDNIAPQTGPVYICQGTEDTTVPPDQSQELQQDLQTDGIPYYYQQYIGSHGFTGLTKDETHMIEEQMNAFLVNQEHP
jgi:acetyl esterase/lipase